MYFIKYLPFGFAVCLVLAHIGQVLFTPDEINENGEIVSFVILGSVERAACGLVVVFMMIVFKINFWKYIFLGLILISFMPFVSFYSRTISIGIGVFFLEITSFSLLIAHLGLNSEILTFLSPGKSKKEKEIESEANTLYFEKKFEKKKLCRVKKIIDENQLISEVIDAARIVFERKMCNEK